ncbi:MAG: hypothetical protein RLZZ436_3823 [Planctomycetota bacterium]
MNWGPPACFWRLESQKMAGLAALVLPGPFPSLQYPFMNQPVVHDAGRRSVIGDLSRLILRRGAIPKLVLICILAVPARGQEPAVPEAAGDKTAAAAEAPSWLNLLENGLPSGWKAFPQDTLGVSGAEGNSVWSLQRTVEGSEPVLICTGQPRGFLWTTEKYSDFELHGEWRFPRDPDGNSGLLLFTQPEERLWPTSIQIQLHQPKAGSIFPSGDASSDNVLELETSAARPIGQWNECRIVCRSGRVSVEVNGRRVGEITGAKPASGHLALQSEGAEVHFRRLRIRRLEGAVPGSAESRDIEDGAAGPGTTVNRE